MDKAIVQLPDWKSAIINGEKVDIGDVESILITGAEVIPEFSFSGLQNLKHVEIADDVKETKSQCFERCTSLETIDFGKGLESIGNYSFYNCEKIEKLRIPGNVKTIGYQSFGGMLSLKHLIIEEGVESIGYLTFNGCPELERIDLPSKSLKYIGGSIFEESKWLRKNKDEFVTVCGILIDHKRQKNVEHIIMPDTITGMIPGAFAHDSFKEIEIGKGIKRISNLAFHGCSSLESVIIPDGVEELGDQVFKNCPNLRRVVVPDSLKRVGASTLKPEYLPNAPKKGCVYAGKAVIGCVGNPKRVDIKAGTFSISPGAFDQAYKLETIVLPDSIREIKCSFLACKYLSSVVIPKEVPTECLIAFEGVKTIKFYTWPESEVAHFAKEKEISVEYLDADISQEELIKKTTSKRQTKEAYMKPSPDKWFRRTGNALAGISNEGLKEIRKNNIKSITLPTEINGHKIERLVFDCLSFLKEVPEVEELVIPGELKIQGLTTTEGRDCWDFPNTETIKHLVFIGKTVINFYRCNRVFDDSLESITIQESDRFISLDGVIYSKDGDSLVLYPRSKKDKKFIVPKCVTTIWGSAFRNVKYLEELVLPEGLKTIYKDNFRDCSIKTIDNPAGVKQSTV